MLIKKGNDTRRMSKRKLNKSCSDEIVSPVEDHDGNIGVSRRALASVADVVMLKQQRFMWFSGKRGENPSNFINQFEELQDEKFTSEILARIAIEKLNDPAKSLKKTQQRQ